MAKQTIDVGSYASDGTGDPLRDAFTKINENFTELYSGNVQITAANVLVESVAGRTGNVVLTVNDVAQAASKSYVNSAIASNLANVTGSITNSLSANINAANLLIADHESRITAAESDINQNTLDIANLTTDKADLTAVYNIVEQYVSANSALSSVAAVNANVAAANLRIAAISTQSNSNSQNITILFANAAAQGQQINVVNANVAAANLRIETLTTNVDNFNGDFLAVQANSAVQAQQINALRANITAANAAFTSANTIQRLDIQSLQYDTAQIILGIGSLGLSINDLSSNDAAITSNIGSYQTWANGYMAAQTVAINSLRANITAANAAISALESLPLSLATLESNAAAQGVLLNTLTSNAATQNNALTALTANAASQALEISGIETVLGVHYDLLTGLTSNAASQQTTLTVLTSNALAQTFEINALRSNLGLYVGNLNAVNSNIGAYQTWANATNSAYRLYANANAAAQSTLIDLIISNLTATSSNVDVALITKANIAGDIFTGNVTAPYIIANASVIANGNIQVGDAPTYTYANVGGSFTDSINGPYGVVIQNTNSGINASSDLKMLPDDGLIDTKRLRVWVNGSGVSGNYPTPDVPGGIAGLTKFPHDGGVSVFGGNAILQSDNGVFLAANAAVAVLFPDGTFSIDKLQLGGGATFNSMTVNGGMSSSTGVAMALDGSDVNVIGNVKVSGGRIKSASNVVITLDTDDVIVNNDLYVGKNFVAHNIISNGNVDIEANTTLVSIVDNDRSLHLINANLKFSDGSIQQTAITDVPALYANIGRLFLGNVTTNANLGAYQLDTNANLGAYQLSNNANVGTLFLGNASTNANLGAYQLSNNANVGTLFLGNASTNANLGAFQTYSNSTIAAMQANIGTIVSVTVPAIDANVSAANAAIQTLSANIGTLVGGAGAALDTLLELGNALSNSGSFSSTMVNWLSNVTANITAANASITTLDANVGTLFLGNASTNANLGAYQTYANTNVETTQANLGAFQTYANANIGTLFLGNASTNANIGAFQIYANTAIDSLYLGANANTAAYLLTSTGNISAGNVISDAYYSIGGTTRFSLTDIGLVAINVSGQEYKFGASGIESSPGIFGGSYAGNKLSLNNETALISNRFDTVTIQTGTDGSIQNTWTFSNNTLSAPGRITALGNIVAANTTESTSTTTGALVVVGGAGISGNLNIGGNVSAGNITVVSNLTVGTGSSGNISGVNYLYANNIVTSANVVTGNIQISGNVNYTPNTAGNYNQIITNMQQALNELAARVKALGG